MCRNSLLRVMALVCLQLACWTTMSAQGGSTLGDVDNDGNVGISDVTALIDGLLSGDASIDRAVADIDSDGKIGISDVAALIDYLLTGELPYVAEPIDITVGSVTFKMIPVQGGTFAMGAMDGDSYARPWESPVHQVTLDDYYIGETEVTQELWRAVMNNNPSYFTGNLQRPVERVTYADCLSFITKLNQKTGKTFRLLTEAEWEFAARGGNKGNGYLYAGSSVVDDVAWHGGNSGDTTHPVGGKAPNELGLYDMGGNVSEMVSDWYGLYSADAVVNPTGPATGTARIYRGGSWNQAFRMCRVTCRMEHASYMLGNVNVGLRLALVM